MGLQEGNTTNIRRALDVENMDNMTDLIVTRGLTSISTSRYYQETTTEIFTQLENTTNSTTASGDSHIDSNIWTLTLSICLFITAIITFLGNLLVLITFLANKRILRSNFNLFLLNLTLTDIGVSITAIPFYGLSYLLGTWPLGVYLCDMWVFCDWGMTFASVYILVAISVDRYWAVCWGHHYRANNTRRRITIMLIVIWVLMLVLWLPAYIDDRIESRDHPLDVCKWSVENNRNFGIVMAILGYHLPSFVIVYCYMRVFVIMRRTRLNLAKTNLTDQVDGPMKSSGFTIDSCHSNNSALDSKDCKENQSKCKNRNGLIKPERDSPSHICDIEIVITFEDPEVKPTHDAGDQSRINDSHSLTLSESDNSYPGTEMQTLNARSSPNFTGSSVSLEIPPVVKRIVEEQRFRPRSYTDGPSLAMMLKKKSPGTVKRRCTSGPAGPGRESHISTTSANITSLKQKSGQQQDYKLFVRLSYIVLAYLICWLPFHVVFDIQLAGITVNKECYTFATLMCYLNSTINPVLYALGNPKLKEAFKQTLKCASSKRAERADAMNKAREQTNLQP